MTVAEIILMAIGVLILVMIFLLFSKVSAVQKEVKDSRVETIQYINEAFKNYGQLIAGNQKDVCLLYTSRGV